MITVFNKHIIEIAKITENEDDWIFNLGQGFPNDLSISKSDLSDPMVWLSAYIGIHNGDEVEDQESSPWLTFVDDETKAIWQVWDVINDES